MLDRGSPGLTPAERADLAVIGGRARMDGGDIRPMYVEFADGHRETIPWMVALNLDVPNIPTE